MSKRARHQALVASRPSGEVAGEVAALREQVRQQSANLDLLSEADVATERMLALEDVGWNRLGAEGGIELPRGDLAKVINRSRLMFLRSPLINRAVNVQSSYVWGQGINVTATDPDVNDLLQVFLDDPKNQAELTSHQARVLKEVDLQVLGNIFFCFFVDQATGAVTVRTIPVGELQDIITNPEDARDPWYYKRTWTQRDLAGGYQPRTAYYPDWRLTPDEARSRAIFRDGEIVDTPVYHVKIGGLSDMRFGLPETYQALDWARAYKEFLEDRATIARALSRFAWRMTSPGGASKVAAAKAKLGSTLGSTSTETNPPALVGSAFIGSPGVTMDPIRLAGATIHPDEGRRFLLMVCAAMGLPETFFGDASVGSLATAKSLDRPTELKFSDRRSLWSNIYQSILQFVIDQALRAPASGLSANVDRHVDVGFPDLLEHDALVRIQAIISAATLEGKAKAGTVDDRTLVRLLLTALGVDQVDELVDQIAPEGVEQPQPTAEAAMTEAIRELRAALANGGQTE